MTACILVVSLGVSAMYGRQIAEFMIKHPYVKIYVAQGTACRELFIMPYMNKLPVADRGGANGNFDRLPPELQTKEENSGIPENIPPEAILCIVREVEKLEVIHRTLSIQQGGDSKNPFKYPTCVLPKEKAAASQALQEQLEQLTIESQFKQILEQVVTYEPTLKDRPLSHEARKAYMKLANLCRALQKEEPISPAKLRELHTTASTLLKNESLQESAWFKLDWRARVAIGCLVSLVFVIPLFMVLIQQRKAYNQTFFIKETPAEANKKAYGALQISLALMVELAEKEPTKAQLKRQEILQDEIKYWDSAHLATKQPVEPGQSKPFIW